MFSKFLYLSVATLVLTGCIANTDSDSDIKTGDVELGEMIVDSHRLVAVSTASPDYSTSDVAFIRSFSDGTASVNEEGLATTDPADTSISVFGDDLYRIGQFSYDNITKYEVDFGSAPSMVWQYSVAGDENEASANPYELVFESTTRAFVIRYGLPEIWVVDPSVAGSGESNFKLGEIDLSAYAHEDSSGTPSMTSALISDGKLYVLMRRLDADFQALRSSYIAVIDLATLEEVDTTQGEDGLKGIKLNVKNAIGMDLHDGKIYIAAKGNGTYYTGPGQYDGGIVVVDTTTYEATLLVDDGDDNSHPYGQFKGIEVVSDDHAYFVGSAEWGNDTLYHFSPTSSSPVVTEVSSVSGINIADIEHESLSDSSARYLDVLYVGIQGGSDPESKGRIDVVSVVDQAVFASVELTYNPTDIEVLDQ